VLSTRGRVRRRPHGDSFMVACVARRRGGRPSLRRSLIQSMVAPATRSAGRSRLGPTMRRQLVKPLLLAATVLLFAGGCYFEPSNWRGTVEVEIEKGAINGPENRQSKKGQGAILLKGIQHRREVGAERLDGVDEGFFWRLLSIDPEKGSWEKLAGDFNYAVWTGLDPQAVAYEDKQGLQIRDSKGQIHRVAIEAERGWTTWRVLFCGDGKQFVIVQSQGGLSELFSERLRFRTWRIELGGKAAELPIPSSDEVEDISADGTWLIVTAHAREARRNSGLYLIHPDGTGKLSLVVTPPNAADADARFSPSAGRLAFIRRDVRGGASIWTVGLRGEDPNRVFSTTDTSCEGIAWSPDGERIAALLAKRIRIKGANGEEHLTTGTPYIRILTADGRTGRDIRLPPGWHVSQIAWRR
jgi:hypothetical protein